MFAERPDVAGKPWVGLCGLGNMGSAIAQRLVDTFQVLGSDPDTQRQAAASALGVLAAGDPARLAQAPIVVLSLPSPQISALVAAQLAPLMQPGSLIIETSTVTPEHVRRLQQLCAADGVRVIDAAILSGVGQMRDGHATLLVGGEPDAIGAADPILRVLGETVRVLGDVGSGMAAKVVNNAVAHAVMVVLVEALAVSNAAGVEPAALVELLSLPDGGLLRPLNHRIVDRVLPANYDGGMPCDAARKDSTLALELAQTHGVPLFAIQAAQTVYDIAVAEGYARFDYSVIARLWDGWVVSS